MSDDAGTDGDNTRTEQKLPWQLGVGLLAWAVLGMTALVESIGVIPTGESGSESVSAIQSQFGSRYAATGAGGAQPVVLAVIGLVVLLLAVLLFLGQTWARLALSAAGVVAVAYFGWTVGFVATLIAMAALVVGSILLLSAPVNRHLLRSTR